MKAFFVLEHSTMIDTTLEKPQVFRLTPMPRCYRNPGKINEHVGLISEFLEGSELDRTGGGMIQRSVRPANDPSHHKKVSVFLEKGHEKMNCLLTVLDGHLLCTYVIEHPEYTAEDLEKILTPLLCDQICAQ